jgi:uncharacterized protein (DUF4415 family)
MSFKHPPLPADDAPFDDPDNPEWTSEDFARARPAAEVLPPEILAAFPKTKVRGAQRAPTKKLVSLRLDQEILQHFKDGGPGWQSRINAALQEAISRKR